MEPKIQKPSPAEEAIRAVQSLYPENIVSDSILQDRESYYDAIRGEIHAALRAIPNTALKYDRPPEGRNPAKDPADWSENPSSYDLLFLALLDEEFQTEGEAFAWEIFGGDASEEDTETVPSIGWTGCAVGISTLAPFASIVFAELETVGDRLASLPDIWPHTFDLDGSDRDLDGWYENAFHGKGFQALCALRETIAEILRQHGIQVLSEPGLQEAVPGLNPDPEVRARQKEMHDSLDQYARENNIIPAKRLIKKTATLKEALFLMAQGQSTDL